MKYFQSDIAGSGTEEDPRHAVALDILTPVFSQDMGDHMIVGYEELTTEQETALLANPGIKVL